MRISYWSSDVCSSDLLGVKLSGISRRDFMQISKRYGLTATYVAAAGMSGVFSAGALATKAEAAEEERKKAKHVLKYGSVFRKEHTPVQRAGGWEFARDRETRTDVAKLRRAACRERGCQAV